MSTFGALRGRPVAWVLDVLGTLEAAGLIMAEGDEYPCLRITAAGREVMLDRARMQSALPAERAAGKRVRVASGGGGGGGGGGEDDDEPVDQPLFTRLRELRSKLAKEEQLPAYCVFLDRTLSALARLRPARLDELAEVPGVGPSKLAKYGAAFLDALRAPES